MAKKYIVTVNGTSYEVVVEDRGPQRHLHQGS